MLVQLAELQLDLAVQHEALQEHAPEIEALLRQAMQADPKNPQPGQVRCCRRLQVVVPARRSGFVSSTHERLELLMTRSKDHQRQPVCMP